MLEEEAPTRHALAGKLAGPLQGATLSFWKERLQLGAGVNLMGEADDDGRYYYFVGSDLISLLDMVGIGN